MRTIVPPQDQLAPSMNSRNWLPLAIRIPSAILAASSGLFVAQLFLAAPPLTAQAPAATPAYGAAHKAVHRHSHSSAAHPPTPLAPATIAPIPPPPPAVPSWPANDRPAHASVVWDSQGLRIEAANSSLQQIMKDFAEATGATIEGLGADERIFGAYGPGKARDVLSQLLQGSSYNVLMIGDQGQGAPRQIVLSARHSGDAQPTAANNAPSGNDDDVDADEPPQPVQPPQAVPAPFRPGFPPRSPQPINPQEQQREQMQQRNNPQN